MKGFKGEFKMKFVCIGDSLTQGYGVDCDACWVSILNRITSHHFINKGKNGETSGEILNRFEKDVVMEHPDYSIIFCGVNDYIYSTNDEISAFQHVKKMCDMAVKYNIQPIIGIPFLTIPELAQRYWADNTDYLKVNQQILSYRKYLMDYAQDKKIKYLDLYPLFQEKIIEIGEMKLFTDGLHLTNLGHELIAECIKRELTL